MSHHQRVEQVPGQSLWVETWSWCDSRSPCAPFIYTSLGGQVNVWTVEPKERKTMPFGLKVVCAIPGIYVFWWAASLIKKLLMEKNRYRGEIVVRVRNSYRDNSGQEIAPRANIRSSANPYTQEEWAFSLFFPRYPRVGNQPTPVGSIQTEAEVFIGPHSFHHMTWQGSADGSPETSKS